MTYHINKVL